MFWGEVYGFYKKEVFELLIKLGFKYNQLVIFKNKCDDYKKKWLKRTPSKDIDDKIITILKYIDKQVNNIAEVYIAYLDSFKNTGDRNIDESEKIKLIDFLDEENIKQYNDIIQRKINEELIPVLENNINVINNKIDELGQLCGSSTTSPTGGKRTRRKHRRNRKSRKNRRHKMR